MTRRITVAATQRIAARLSERDQAILRTLSKYKVATTQQLQRLHFYQGTPLADARQSRRVLRRLAEWRTVARLERSIGGARAGSAGQVWALDVAGQRLLSMEDGRPRRPWTPGLPFLAHTLAITELGVRLAEWQRRASQEATVEFITEPSCWRNFTFGHGGAAILKPDGLVRIQTEQFDTATFIEVDRGTCAAGTLARKADTYRHYWLTGREQAASDFFPQVLWLVPADRRHQQLVEVLSRQPAEGWQLHRVAHFDDAIAVLTDDAD